ncbi:diacylglycerol kinase family protein [Draconibacterium sp. IB214405]|uniref:diacylglycerol/lipid kinase family protein n=1 Tax=Draconibacterium sp. IB214405 TaxID=3097352 RepID=UPI002A127C16|nr:diacylglycerol kinase family protein [Draconibacterium sp. IB214405]MDX8340335.1 diacylglycerol kinase family protein [Draconibacterium sp. IB214405]
MRTAVLINGFANNGSAEKKWDHIEDEVRKNLPIGTLYIHFSETDNHISLMETLVNEYRVKNFVSAGGDGSLNNLINTLAQVTNYQLKPFSIGAIGLGSSNDFLKPVRRKIRGIPVRIDFENNTESDLGIVEFHDRDTTQKQLFIVNASLGFTAQGNRLFNDDSNKIIHFLKPRSTNLCILWTIAQTLLSYKNIDLEITYDEKQISTCVTNLSISKNPNVSGSFCYDIDPGSDSGCLGFYLAENFNRQQIPGLLYSLYRKQFSKAKNCKTALVQSVEITSAKPVLLETDGEIIEACRFRFSVLPTALFVAD